MNKTFLVLLIFASMQIMAQNNPKSNSPHADSLFKVNFDTSSSITVFPAYSFNNYQASEQRDGHITSVLINDENGSIEIEGDTMEVIKMLIRFIRQKDSTTDDLWKFVESSVYFSNHVPDYWRTKEHNCKWPKYLSYLKQFGFKETRSNQSKNTCK